MITYAVADIHGRYDLLTKALELIEADCPQGGKFIQLGDFVDRGPESRQVVERLMAGPTLPGWEWVILQGNHEAMMLQCLEATGLLRWWFQNGGGRTMLSYGYQEGDQVLPLKIPQAHLDWIVGLPITHQDNHRIFVHAGVPHDVPLAVAPQQHLQWMLHRDPTSDEHYADAQYFDDLAHCSGQHIVHGHHQSATHPLLLPHRTNLDSYAWRTGRLAIGVFDDTQPQPIKVLEVTGDPA